MFYQITFTNKFKKQYNNLNNKEKNQLKNKISLLSETPLHPSLRTKKLREPLIYLSQVFNRRVKH